MLYKVYFEDGKPISAEEYYQTDATFQSGELTEKSIGEYVYTWRIVIAVSSETAIKVANG